MKIKFLHTKIRAMFQITCYDFVMESSFSGSYLSFINLAVSCSGFSHVAVIAGWTHLHRKKQMVRNRLPMKSKVSSAS